MKFKHKDFVIVANNQALVDFSPVYKHCVNKNVFHLNTPMHYERFKNFDNYIAFYSFLKSNFFGTTHVQQNMNRFNFLGALFMIKENQNTPKHIETHYSIYDQFPHSNKDYIYIPNTARREWLKNAEPSGGFTLCYYLLSLYPHSRITLVGFSGRHNKPEGKYYGQGHWHHLEQRFYKYSPRINLLLEEKPCSTNFHFPCNMCKSNTLEEARTKCLTEDRKNL